MIRLCWHGSGSIGLGLGGTELLVDPYFTPAGVYGDWFRPNENAPDLDAFCRQFNPAYVLITHGHFDHLDLHTCRTLGEHLPSTFVGSPEVTATLERECGLPSGRLLAVEPGGTLQLGGCRCLAEEGVHWLCNEEGDELTETFGGLEQFYGAFPCGGPMLSLWLQAPEGTVYISGDTELAGIPSRPVDLAVLNVAGGARRPGSEVVEFPCLVPADVPAALERLQPKVAVAVHYDSDFFAVPVDRDALGQALESRPGTRVLRPPFNEWVEVRL